MTIIDYLNFSQSEFLLALFLINFFTVGIPETNALKAHLIESVPYFRFLMMGLGLLFIMRYRPKGILPEKIEIK